MFLIDISQQSIFIPLRWKSGTNGNLPHYKLTRFTYFSRFGTNFPFSKCASFAEGVFLGYEPTGTILRITNTQPGNWRGKLGERGPFPNEIVRRFPAPLAP